MRIAIDVGKYLLAVGLLVWVVHANWDPPNGRGLGYVWQRHVVEREPIQVGFLLAALIINVCALLITLLRWYFLVKAQDLPFRLRDALRLGLIGVFFNTFMPGSVGGDIIKAAALATGQARRTVAVATVIMDRVTALWALIWFVAISGSIFWATGLLDGPIKERSIWIVEAALGLVAITLCIWMLVGFLPDRRAEIFAGRLERIPKIGSAFAELWRAAWLYRRRQAVIAGVMALSWCGHVCMVLVFFCCANVLWSDDLGPIPTLTQHFILVPIGLVVQAIIPTPGGAGGGELGFGGLYVLFGSDAANGVLASLVRRLLEWSIGLVGCAVFLRTPIKRE